MHRLCTEFLRLEVGLVKTVTFFSEKNLGTSLFAEKVIFDSIEA